MLEANMKRPACRHKKAAGKLLAVLLASSGILSGCASVPSPNEIAVPSPFRSEAVNFLREQPVVVLRSQPNDFWTVDYDKGDPLPNISVGPIRARDVPVSSIFDMIATEANLGIVKDPGLGAMTVSYADPKARPLDKVLGALTAQTGLFYHYQDGILSFSSSRRFFVKIPRVAIPSDKPIKRPTALSSNSSSTTSQNNSASSSESGASGEVTPPDFKASLDLLAKAVSDFGATDVVADNISGTIVFTGDQSVYRAVQRLIKSFEMGRDMIVYDIWILERDLNNTNELGLEVKNLSMLGGNVGATVGGLTTGVFANPTSSTLDAIIHAVDTNGKASTISRPTLPVISGSYSSFVVGEEQQYISKLDNTSSTQNDTTSNSTETGTVRTGLSLVIGGAYTDGIVNTQLNLDINSLIEFQEFKTGASDTSASLKLPHTATRSLMSTLDARPGDLIVIGGLIQGKSEMSNESLAGILPLSRTETGKKSELIMFMRPRLVKIRPAGEDENRLTGSIDIPVSQSSASADSDERAHRLPVSSSDFLGAKVPSLVKQDDIPAPKEGYVKPPSTSGFRDDEIMGASAPTPRGPAGAESTNVEPAPWWKSDAAGKTSGEQSK